MVHPRTPRSRRRVFRGFTLIELMVVVLIIGILAWIGIPAIGERLRERRSSEAAQRAAALYRTARLRAMGRGGAVLVRYNAGKFDVLEAIQGGPDPDCDTLPLNRCVGTNFDAGSPNRQVVTSFYPTTRGEFEGVSVSATVLDPSGAAQTAATQIDICYTPMGRAYMRTLPGAAFNPMTGVATITVGRTGSLQRTVTVLPNGMARVAL